MCKCNTNNTQTTTQCHVCHQKPKCPPKEPCDCAVKDLSTNCILYDQEDLPCSNIKSGQSLSAILLQLDTFICNLRDELIRMFTLKNIGVGAKIYKGIDSLGRKELRTVTKTGNLITVTENTNDIAISIDERALDTFIEENQKTYSVNNIGTGVQLYKNSNISGNNTQFNFRTVVQENQGNGESFLRDIQQNSDDLKVRVKTLVSDNLTITSTNEEVRIETPLTASIPALYVNNLYKPTYQEWLTENKKQNSGVAVAGFQFRGKGTLAQPFTDTIVYTLNQPLTPPTTTANTAIQNALDAYVGTGLGADGINPASRLNPKRSGQWIIVQNNNSFYYHYGDYNYSNLKIRFQCSVVNTTSNYIVDMDNPSYFNSQSSGFTISIDEGIIFQCTDSLGFRNSGNTSSLPPSYDTGRIGIIGGEGTLYFSYNGPDILNRYIFTGEGNNNDDNLHFQVKCIVRADQQGIYLTKNKMRIDFYNLLQSGVLLGSGNTSLKAFHMTGGQIRFYEKGAISLQNGVTSRTYGFTFQPEDDGIGYCIFQLNSAKVAGVSLNCFAKLNNEHVDFLAFNSPSGDDFATTLLGVNTVVNGLFENLGVDRWNINFKNNVFSYTGIDDTKVDLTQGNNTSTINFIGSSVLEHLVVYNNRANAIAAGRPINSIFLNRSAPGTPEGNETSVFPNTGKWYRDIVLPA